MIFITALRKEILELLRTYRFLVAAVLLIFFGLASPLLAKYMREIIGLVPDVGDITSIIPVPTMIDAVIQFEKNTSQFGFLLAVLLGMGSVAQEKEKGTAAMMLVKPLPRSTFILAKFTALGLLFLVTVLLAGLGAFYYTTLLFEAPDLGAWMWFTLLLVLEILVYAALTILCSTLLRTPVAAGGAAVGLMLGMVIFGSLPGIGEYFPGELSNWGIRLVMGDTQTSWPAVILCAAIILCSLGAAMLSFRRQEL